MDNTERPKRERPTLAELTLLLERFDQEPDPTKKQDIQQQIDAMRHEIAQANDT